MSYSFTQFFDLDRVEISNIDHHNRPRDRDRVLPQFKAAVRGHGAVGSELHRRERVERVFIPGEDDPVEWILDHVRESVTAWLRLHPEYLVQKGRS